ncbi:MAG: hypothetical protein QOJ03_1253 [Frankiaceae bacterium]|jgi:hypothetical protein|nr:hypothetical protein [Frankiaceae bacterium]
MTGPASDAPQSVPTVEELDRLSTDELRHLAFERAERDRDVGFFWDLVRHLPQAEELAAEDASSGAITAGLAETIELVRELLGRGLGDAEPLVRARFISYIRGED